MKTKRALRFVLALCLAIGGLTLLFGMLAGAQERVYAAEPHSVPRSASDPTNEVDAPRTFPRLEWSQGPVRAPATSSPMAPLSSGSVGASTVITVCKPTAGTCDYPTIQEAVSDADPGTIIKVAQGVYTDADSDGYVVEITRTLTLRGGYTVTNWIGPDLDGRPTILDGEGGAQVVRISAGGPTVEGFHIWRGSATQGAGVYIASGEAVVRRNRIYGNVATDTGGGVHVAGGSPVLENNLIYTNTTDGQGGGIYVVGSDSPLLRYNTLYDNRADNSGGGIFIASGSPIISASIIVSNVAGVDGGGIYKDPALSSKVKYNNVFGNSLDDYSGFLGGTLGNISVPPRFVDPASGNFRLQADSLCIGRDEETYPKTYPEDDYDGHARPFDAWADMGAHEFYAPSTCYAQVVGGQVYTTVQEAVDAASSGGVVKVAGLCTGNGTNVVNLAKSLTLQGGYTETYWSDYDWDTYPTILDGESTRQVVYVATNVPVMIEGFHIYNGKGIDGGGIYVGGDYQTSTIRSNRIYSNSASGKGGGLYLLGGSPTVQDNEIYSNTSSSSGGGVCVEGSNTKYPMIDSNSIHHNQGNGSGGGISVLGNTSPDYTVTIRHNEVYSNTSNGYGGGINIGLGFALVRDNGVYSNTALRGGGIYVSANGTVKDNTVSGNRAVSSGDNDGGGGVYLQGNVSLRGNIIHGNVITGTGLVRGGGIHVWVSGAKDVTIENNRIDSNSGKSTGGGIYVRMAADTVVIRNNLIYTNTTAGDGGGIGISTVGNPATVENNTMYDNWASSNGGGVWAYGSHVIRNNIIVGNADVGIFGASGTPVATYNDVWNNPGGQCGGSASCDATNISADPQFVNPGVNFRLQSSSPCIGAITSTVYPTYDYDNYARPYGVYADVGAHEFYTGTCFARLSTGGRVYTTVQAAVFTATAGVDDVLVAGLCQGADATVTISKSLALRGGYTVTNWISPTTPTTLDASSVGRVITITAASPSTVTVERFIVTGGDAGAADGGGIYVTTSLSPTIQNIIFYNNSANNGGGFASSGGNPRLYNNTFVSNTATTNGGGLYLNGGSPVVSNTIVVSNSDGIYGAAGSVLAYNNVWSNSGGNYGGGLSQGDSDISEPPGFVDPANADFRLRFDSPSVHAGDPGTGLVVDFEGDARPDGTGQGQRYDIGADEATDYLGVNLGPDLGQDGIPGQVLEYTQYLTNTGTRDDDFSITYTLQVSGTPQSGWSVDIASDYTLLAGEVTEVPVDLGVPAGATSGTQATLFMTATYRSGGLYFFDVATITTVVRSDWSFLLSPSYDQKTANPGDLVVYTHLMTNTGTPDTFTVTPSSNLGWVAVSAGQVTLGSGETTPIYITVTVPLTASSDAVETAIVVVTSQGAAEFAGRLVRDAVTDTTYVNYTYGDRYVATWGNDNVYDSIGLNSCRISSAPCRTIEQAIGQASGGEVVRVAGGTYQEYNLSLNKAIELRGGYTMTNWTTADPDANPTVIDAEQYGRVLYIGGSPIVEGFTLQNGQVNGYGGGIYVAQGVAPILRRLRLKDNTARSSGGGVGRGGGVYNAGGDLTLERCTIAGNTAGDSGGGFYYRRGTSTRIWNNLFYDNVAGNYGGGFYNADGDPLVWHNTFVRNTADYGGGLALIGGAPVVSNTIVVSNTAIITGGGVYSQAASAALDYNDVWNNNVGTDTNDYVGASAGSNSISANPLFVDAAGGDFHLLKGSPCINQGDGVDDAILGEDLDGQWRTMDGQPDIGADEYQRADVVLVSLDPNQVGGQGRVLTYTHILTNTGNYYDSFLLTWQRSDLAHGWVVTVGGYTTQPVTVPMLGYYEATTIEVHIQVPSDIPSSTVNQTFITATSQLDTDIYDLAVSTTTVTQTVGVSLEPHRVGWSGFGVPVAVPVVYTHTLTNEGNYTDTFDLSIHSSVVGPGAWPVTITVPASRVVTLPKDGSFIVSVVVTVPIWANEVDVHTTTITATSRSYPFPSAIVTDTTIAKRRLGVELEPDSTGWGDPGGPPVEHIHTLTNTGNYTDTYVLTYSSERGWLVTFSTGPTVTVGAWPAGPGATVVEAQVSIPHMLDIPPAFGGYTDTVVITATSLSSPTLTSSVTDVTTATRKEGADLYPDYVLRYNKDESETENKKFVRRVVVTPTSQLVTFTHTLYNNSTSNSTDTFTLTVSSTPDWSPIISPTLAVELAWHGLITDVVVTVTVPPAILTPTVALEATVVATATSWFSPTGASGQDTVTDVIVVNQWLGVELSPGGSRQGPSNSPPAPPTELTIVYTHALTNTGNYTDSFTLSGQASPSPWNSVGFGGGDPTGDVGPGQTEVVTVEVTVPYTLCTATGIVTITAETRTLEEGTAGSIDGGMDTVTDTIVITPVYYADLTPGFTLRYSSTTAGAILESYTRWLTNTGNCSNFFDLGAQGSFTPTLMPTRTSALSSRLVANFSPTPVAITITVPQSPTGFNDLMVGTVVVTTDGDFGGYDRVTDTIVINQHVEAALEPGTTETITEPGSVSIMFYHVLTNAGNYTDTFQLTWWNEDSWTVNVVNPPIPVTLGSLATETIQIQVTADPDVYTWTNRTWITATSVTPKEGTAGYTQTATAVDTTLIRRPHVTLEPDQTVEVDHNTTYTYFHTLRNSGGLTDTYVLTYTSDQPWVDVLTPTKVYSLSPGSTRAVTVVVSVPYGTSYLVHDVTHITATSEMSYTYVVFDTVTDTTRVRRNVDAELTPNYTARVEPGKTITRVHTLTNTGNYTESFTLSTYTEEEFNVALSRYSVQDLEPGGAIPVTVTISIPGYAAGGVTETVKINLLHAEEGLVTSAEHTVYVSYTTGTRFVAPNGSDDSNNCTMRDNKAPCLTVQHAVDQAVHGDTVKVAGGTYFAALGADQVVRVSESITLTGGYSTDDWDNSEPSARPTVLDAQGQLGLRVIEVDPGITPTIAGFHVRGGNVSDDGAGVYIGAGAAPTLTLNLIYGNTTGAGRGGGIYYGGSGSPVLERNAIYSNTATFGGGIYLSSGGTRVWSNLIYHNQASYRGGGLYSLSGAPLIWHNTFYSNTTSDPNGGGGIYVSSGTPVVSNTIVAKNAGYGIRAGSGAVPDLAYNDVWDNVGGEYLGTPAGTGDISEDPRFADVLGADFRLTYSSPCIDAGDPNSSQPPDLDYEGNARLLRDWPDIGAFEYGLVGTKGVTASAQPSTTIAYTIKITNTGSVTHTYRVTDTLHQYLDTSAGVLAYTAGSGVYLTPTGFISWTGPVAGNGTVVDITFTARVFEGVGAGTQITNVAWVDYGPVAVVTTTVQQITGTRYVAVGGDDTDNDCTLEDDPCATLQRAVDQATEGDLVKVAAGAYTTDTLAAGQVVSVSKDLTLMGGYTYVSPTDWDWETFDPGTYTTTLEGSGAPAVGIGPAAVMLAGFHIVGGTDGIHVAGGDLTLERSWVHGNEDGVEVDNGGAYEMVNSIVAQNTSAGLRVAAGSDGVVIHDTFAGNAYGAVISGTARFTNTIFSTHTVAVVNATGSVWLWNALWWDNTTDAQGTVISSTSTFSNPLFVDAAGMNYHIQEASGAIDEGVSVPGLAEDIDGEAREVMYAPDIGADEYPLGLDKYGPEFAEPGETITYTIELKAKDVDLVITDVLPIHLAYAGTVTCTVGSCGYLDAQQAITWTGTTTVTGGALITYTARITSWVGRDEIIVNTASLERQGIINESEAWQTVITPVHAIRYVASKPSGADLDPGTGTDNNCRVDWKPCATVQWALDQALAGDTVRVAGGTYTSTAAPVVYVNKTITLTGGYTTAGWVRDVDGFPTYLDGQNSVRVMDVDGTAGSVTVMVEGFHLLNGYVSSGGGGGLRVNAADVTLARSRVYSNTAAGSNGGGIFLFDFAGGSNVTLSGNRIYANTTTGVGGGMYAFGITPFLVVNNVVAGNQAGGGGDGLFLDACFGDMHHNTIADNAAEGLRSNNSGLTLNNTIVAGHTAVGIYKVGGLVTANYTLWYNNGTDTSGGVTDNNPLPGDPKFVNPAAWDYHIRPDSDALDAGVDAGVDTDIDGDVRPMGNGPDVGVDELRVTLSVTKRAEPDPVVAGQVLTYTIRVTNTGQLTLTATVTDILPAGVVPTGVWTTSVGTIVPDGFREFVITVEATYSGTLANVVQVTSAEGATGVFTETSSVTGIPDITVNPLSLSRLLAPGVTDTYTLTIGNVDRAELIWDLMESPTVTWLSEVPTNGILFPSLPSATSDVMLSFDATGLPDGPHTTTLQVRSNDPDEPQVDVGVVLTVCTPASGASFTHDPIPQVDKVTAFTGTVVSGTLPVNYTWDFGDSGSGSGEVVTHTYTVSDTYTVVMTATNCYGTAVTTYSQAVSVIGAADIVVSPSALNVTLGPGGTTTRTLTISNTGTVTLSWSSLTENPPRGWLSESPTSGNVAPSGSSLVTVSFDAAGLGIGTYTTTLQITSNDPDTPQLSVPVVLQVDAPDIAVDPLALNVTLGTGGTTTRTFTISNTGTVNLSWSSLTENPPRGWLSESPTSGIIAPSGSTDVVVTFDSSGLSGGTYTTTLQINSDDPDEPQVNVDVELVVSQNRIYLPLVLRNF